MIVNNILELIGNTPIVRLPQFDAGLCELFIKLESHNPGRSIKDRIALAMVNDAEETGRLKPGGTIVEATAGNTGISLALVALQKGYQCIIVMPDKMSREKVDQLKAIGATVILTRSDVNKGDPAYYHDLAEQITKDTPNACYINQFNNPINATAHETLTGPEIWTQMGEHLDAIVLGVGTSGTITGVGRYLKRVNPEIDIVLADPKGSILKHYIDTGELIPCTDKWLVEGIGEDYIPTISDLSVVTEAITVNDHDAMTLARALFQKAGIFSGSSSGALLQAALTYSRAQTTPKRVLTLACDCGSKYLSKLYNTDWMTEHGFLETHDA